MIKDASQAHYTQLSKIVLLLGEIFQINYNCTTYGDEFKCI